MNSTTLNHDVVNSDERTTPPPVDTRPAARATHTAATNATDMDIDMDIDPDITEESQFDDMSLDDH